jgi:hypothetical protein
MPPSTHKIFYKVAKIKKAMMFFPPWPSKIKKPWGTSSILPWLILSFYEGLCPPEHWANRRAKIIKVIATPPAEALVEVYV